MFIVGKEKRNRTAEEKGVWFEYDEGVRFLVARTNNSGYKLFIQQAYAKNERVIERKSKLADDLAEQITLDALCNHILLGWEGMVDMKGKAIPFSPAMAKDVLEEYDDLRAAIFEYATNRANFLQEAETKAVETIKK